MSPSPSPDQAQKPFVPWYDLSLRALPTFERALWIFGATGAGKSTVAQALMAGCVADSVLETGHYVRDMHGPEATTDEITATAVDCLDKDPRYFAKKIALELEVLTDGGLGERATIVVGARNPVDVAACFDTKRDGALWLFNGVTFATTFEEAGLQAIYSLLWFWRANDFLHPSQYMVKERVRGSFQDPR